MDEPKKAYRKLEDAALFTAPSNNRAIVPDYVSPAVEGYFRIPAIWVGEHPAPEQARELNPAVHHAIVLKRKLSCGIECWVQRDGTFLFDFSNWPLAPLVVIPGYVIPDLQAPYVATREHQAADDQAEAVAVFRAQVMNAHQALLSSAENIVRQRSAFTGYPVTAWNTIKALRLTDEPYYHDAVENIHGLARNVLNNKDHVRRSQPHSRRVIEIDVINKSLEMLDDVLSRKDPAIVQLVEASYISICRQTEKRFGECIIIGWSVCEQIISLTWKRLLDDEKAKQDGAKRMSKDRRAKLTGRDYTASVMVELLAIQGKFDLELYRLLEIARKARNRWAHDMKPPSAKEIACCHQAMRRLLRQVLNIDLRIGAGGYGGVPKWPIWFWSGATTKPAE